MQKSRRLNATIDAELGARLDRETVGRSPKLPKRYVVELALKRLFDDLDRGQLDLELPRDREDGH